MQVLLSRVLACWVDLLAHFGITVAGERCLLPSPSRLTAAGVGSPYRGRCRAWHRMAVESGRRHPYLAVLGTAGAATFGSASMTAPGRSPCRFWAEVDWDVRRVTLWRWRTCSFSFEERDACCNQGGLERTHRTRSGSSWAVAPASSPCHHLGDTIQGTGSA